MTGRIYRPEDKHPEPYQHDLNPNASQGINWGDVGPQAAKENPRTAKEIKELHNRLSDFRDDELDRIPVLPVGARLEARATYLDLRHDAPSEFKAEGREVVTEDAWIVPKTEVDYQLWNRLRGITDPERTGMRSE